MNDVETVGPAARARQVSSIAVAGLPLVGVLALLGSWWLAKIVFNVPSFLLPSPGEVLASFNRLRSYLLEQAQVTLAETLLGFGLAVAVGMLMGVMIASSRTLERMFFPWLVALNAVPKVAVAPLFVVWIGLGMAPKVLMVIVLCFFPIVISTATGLMSMPRELGELARSLDVSWRLTFIKMRFPYALPQIFVGLKIAIPLAVVGAVIGEFAGSDSGLGFVIVQSGGVGDTPQAFAAVALLAVMGMVLFYALVGIERLLLPWVRETITER
jgi:NitT/TauT family transport system permease protein